MSSPLSILNRDAVAPYSPGLPLRLPWDLSRKNYSTAKRLRHFLGESKSAQPLGGWDSTNLLPRVAEAANPGLKVTTALRFAAALRIRLGIFQSSLNPFVSRQRSRKLLASIGRKSRAL